MKAIKTLVIGMGLLIVVGIGFLAWGLLRANSQLARHPGAEQPGPALAVTAGVETVRSAPYLAEIVLPAGMKIERMEVAGNLIVLQTSGGDGRIVVVDPRNGQIIGSIHPLTDAR